MLPARRPYRDEADLVAIKRFTGEQRLRRPQAGDPHPGDLDWWLYYLSADENRADILHLWEDERGLRGWMILYEPNAFDMAVHPDERGGALEAAIIAEGIRLQSQRPHDAGAPLKAFACADESARIALLEQAGFTYAEDYLVCFSRPLTDADLAAPPLPDGFAFLPTVTADDVERRAAVHIDAFHSKRMTTAAYHHFRTAPGYDPALDVAVIAPDGVCAAYAMVWVDPLTGFGLFEPVGTRHAFQRRGLGSAALREGLRRMRGRGMTTATVLTGATNAGNITFYQSVGFRQVNMLRCYTRPA